MLDSYILNFFSILAFSFEGEKMGGGEQVRFFFLLFKRQTKPLKGLLVDSVVVARGLSLVQEAAEF